MRIPPRVEVLSWNENQVADLVREHMLLDCVDCVYQRHIDGQKLLNLKEGDVLYFLEIHNERSRAKLWSIIKRIAEKKSGVQDLMGKFQQSNGRKLSEEEQALVEDWSSDEFSGSDFGSESDNYDVPDPEEIHPENHGKKISLDRQETIRKNLQMLMAAKRSPSPENLEDYPDNEELYDVPEDGCGEPEQDVYETPSDESGGGVVTRKAHSTVCRQQSEQYIVPNQQAENTSDDEEQYEDLSGTPAFEQEDYVVPDMNPAAVPPRPPKPGVVTQPAARPLTPDSADEYIEPDDNGMENYEPPPLSRVTKKPEQKKSLVEQLQENYEPPRPPSKTNKSPVVPRQKNVEPQRSPPFRNKKPEVIPQENYEPPRPPSKTKKSPVVQQKNVEPQESPFRNKKPEVIPQENYEPPRPPSKTKKSPVVQQKNVEPQRSPFRKKKPEVIPQENYEPPRPPSKTKKSPVVQQKNVEPQKSPFKNKKPEVIPQENYEPPRPPSKTKKSPVVQQKNVEPQKSPFKHKKTEVIPQENYEPPRPPSKIKKSPVVQQKNVEPQKSPFKNKKPEVIPQENYEPPRPPSKIKPVTLEQENYEPPQHPSKHKPFLQGMKKAFSPESKKTKPLVPENKKAFFQESKKPITEDLEQENYEPPPQPLRKNKISVVKQEGLKSSQPPPNSETLDIEEPEEQYEAVEYHDDHSANGDEGMEEQENYEIPVTEPEPPVKPTPRHMSFNPRNIFNKRDSCKKSNLKQPAKPAPPQKSPIRNVPQKPDNGLSAADRQLPPKPSSSPKNMKVFPPPKAESKTAQKRQSIALPSLPARKELPARRETLDHVDSKTSKPAVVNERPLPPRKSPRLSREELTLPITPSSAPRPAGPSASPRLPPRVSPSKPPLKSNDQLLHEQPWFHGSVKKEVYSDMLKKAKKDGAFLVRNSSRDPRKKITSIYFKSNIIHLNMPCEQGMYKLGDSGNVKFSSITELIEHFRKNHVEFATGGSTPLTHACVETIDE